MSTSVALPSPAENPAAAGPPLSVHLVTLGCARNEVDSEELAARLADGGFALVADPADADAVMVNTCGFVEAAKKDSVDTLLAAADLKSTGRPQAVVAVGCLAERYGSELADALPEADAVLGFDHYADVADRLQHILAGEHHQPHVPRDRRKLLPVAPAARPAAAGAVAIPGHGSDRAVCRTGGPGQRSAHRPSAAGRRPVRATQDRLRLRPSLHLLCDPGVPRLLHLPPARPTSSPRRAGWSARAFAKSSWSARTPRPTARISATSGPWRRCSPTSRSSRNWNGSGSPTCSPPRCGRA